MLPVLFTLVLALASNGHAARVVQPLSVQPKAGSVSKAPPFCHDLNCPTFVALNQIADNVELRVYDAAAWVSTNVTSKSYDSAVSKGFMRLFAYISGKNEEGIKIDMTAPVRVLVTPGAGPFCEDHFTVSFFVPFMHQDAPPQPSSPDVYIETADGDDVKVYVLSYGGHATQAKVLEQAKNLASTLDQNGYKGMYDTSTFWTAGYDSPFRIFDRHNEIWMAALE